jgi:hypothetical protein
MEWSYFFFAVFLAPPLAAAFLGAAFFAAPAFEVTFFVAMKLSFLPLGNLV